ncbi:signal peptidase II [Deinococcus wulumuqiensis]|uniref:signal peptidase II n=1 Tax=Deinococcus wulumuqiensis TaxID=980427 RepID=UPI003C6C1E68
MPGAQNVTRILPVVPTAPRRFPLWFPPVLAVVLIALDQWLKAWAVGHLLLGADPIPVIPGLLDWELTYNTGAAWSMFSGSAGLLALGRLLVGLAILGYLLWKPQNRFLTVVLSLIAAGAVGNAIDGLRQSKVTDMIHSPLLSAVTEAINGSRFPIFNIADMCVVGGTLLLLVASFLPDAEQKKTAPET